MNIRDLLNENMIEIGAELSTKDEALDKLIELQRSSGTVRNTAVLRREIHSREMLGSSAVSMRAAISSVRHSGAIKTGVSAVTIKEGISCDSPDKRPVKLVFMITGKDGTDENIEVKARLMHLLMDSEFTAGLCAAESKEEFLELIEEREKVRYPAFEPDKKYDCSGFLKDERELDKRKILFFKRNKSKI